MTGKDTEACGRCSMTTVVDATTDDEPHDLFGDDRIEVDESEIRMVARPQIALGRVKTRIDEWATRFVHGR